MTKGRVTLICGCMFSGKSERLVGAIERSRRAGRRWVAFKHASDNRYAIGEIVTHSGQRIQAIPVENAHSLPADAAGAELVIVDEAQFFDNELVEVCRSLAGLGREVIVAGLDLDSWGQPFGPMPLLAEIADEVVRTTGTCARCGGQADHTQRLTPVLGQQMVGGAESYEARCSACFVPPPAELRR